MVVKEERTQEVATNVLDGKAVAASVRGRLKESVAQAVGEGKRAPGLAVVLVGDDPASALYVQGKIKACKQVGIESSFHKFEATATQDEIIACVRKLNGDPSVDGILVQLPLPKHISSDTVLEALDSGKDVDGLTTLSMGLLLAGKKGLRPCTPMGIIELLDHYKIAIEGKKAVVIGRSNLVGKPIALLLMQRNATVTVCHSRTQGLENICRDADILVVAAGRRNFVKGSWVKPGSAVIDVGIHHTKNDDGSSVIDGDVEYPEARKHAAFITPVPGGVGPMTIAMLLSNTFLAYEEHLSNG
ncbi:MAG TPA: bifunctional methylenetetrahydrofolate dehydrogenase/methenyltetrahydrofolate cyclohydrolase FolD [Oculatellaceae cyanobacterium]